MQLLKSSLGKVNVHNDVRDSNKNILDKLCVCGSCVEWVDTGAVLVLVLVLSIS